ncbi:13868_t:CDS:2, partial [Funneliformis mosseae]
EDLNFENGIDDINTYLDLERVDELSLYNIQKLIDRLEFEDPMVAQEFAIIDDNIILETLTDEDIIQSVQPTQNNNEKNEEIVPIQPISSMTALSALDNILSFLTNPPDGFAVELKNLMEIRSLRSQIDDDSYEPTNFGRNIIIFIE